MNQALFLVPEPKKIIRLPGEAPQGTPVLEHGMGSLPAEAYQLEITPAQITLTGDAAGLFYARQTLLQVQWQFPQALPCLRIEDAPR